MKFVIILAILLAVAAAHPGIKKRLDEVVQSDPCLKRCMTAVQQSELELSITKTVDYASYLLNLDKICSIIASAKQCVDGCKNATNPFALRSMTVMCIKEIRDEVKNYSDCLKKHGNHVMGLCEGECGNVTHVAKQIETLTDVHNEDDNSARALLSVIMRKTDDVCRMNKCFARCSRQAYTHLCRDVDVHKAGEFLYKFIDRVNNAIIQDLEDQRIVHVMAKSTPIQCNYMYTPKVLFDKEADERMLMALNSDERMKDERLFENVDGEGIPDSKYQFLLQKQLLEKRNEVLDKELEKTNLQIELLHKQLSAASATLKD